jgi:hypothetical protein
MKEPVELRKKFAGFPRVGSAGLDFGIQKRLPKLNTSRSGRNDPKGSMSGMPQPGFEMEGGEEESLKIDTAEFCRTVTSSGPGHGHRIRQNHQGSQ